MYMGLLNLFQTSPQQKLRKEMEKCFDHAVREADRASTNPPVLSGSLCFSSISKAYDSLKKNDELLRSSGLSRAEYLQLLEATLNKKGREYISNWDQMIETYEFERQEEDQHMMWNIFKKRISPEEAYKGNFLLAFSFIPMVVDLYNLRIIEEDGLSNTHIWKSFFGSGYNKIDWDKTYTTIESRNPNYSMYIIHFSEPYYLGSAKTGLIVCLRKNHKARYFTLESSLGGNVICECVGKNHSNYGIVLPDSVDCAPFISHVMTIMNIKDHD